MKHPAVRNVLLCALLTAGLLWDAMGFLRMTLLCALVHESGHVLMYVLCLHELPRLSLDWGGITLSGAQRLSRNQELLVLSAGPAANFLMTVLLFMRVWHRAGYRLYFLAAISLCTGVYNLMPFGVLDGARILQNILPVGKQDVLHRAQRAMLFAFCAALLCAVISGEMPPGARAAAFLGPCYLLAQEFFHQEAR